MPAIEFSAKVRRCGYIGSVRPAEEYDYVMVPALSRAHCDMAAFRSHPRYGSYANSDMFLGMMERHLRDTGVTREYTRELRLDRLPSGVTVDTSKFLARITVNVP